MHRRVAVALPVALATTGCAWGLRAGPEVRAMHTGTALEARGTATVSLGDASGEEGIQFGIPLSVSGGARLSGGQGEGTFESGLEYTEVIRRFGFRGSLRFGAGLGETVGAYTGLRAGPVLMLEPARSGQASPALTLEGLLGFGMGGDIRSSALYGVGLSFGWDGYPEPLRIPSGRPFRLEDGTEWRGSARLGRKRGAGLGLELASRVRERTGLRYLEDALDEYASVAAFERLAFELAVHGAPASLVRRARSAAEDEIRHARICFALAAAHLGRDVRPSELPVRAVRSARSLADVARECFLDGCVGEGIASEVVRARAEIARDPRVKRALRGIARDERRHAAFGRDVLAWGTR